MCLLVIMPPEYLIIVEVRNPTTALVVGGGIVGLATAFRLSQKLPDADITVIEKESAVGRHQSGHNSGVLHAGLYYKPGSTKADSVAKFDLRPYR
jgi:L-2-hydroxyglutarate oxidase LhgO